MEEAKDNSEALRMAQLKKREDLIDGKNALKKAKADMAAKTKLAIESAKKEWIQKQNKKKMAAALAMEKEDQKKIIAAAAAALAKEKAD